MTPLDFQILDSRFFIGFDKNEKAAKRFWLYKIQKDFHLSWELTVSEGIKKAKQLNHQIFVDSSCDSIDVYKLCYKLNTFLSKETEDLMTLCVIGKDNEKPWTIDERLPAAVNENRIFANKVLGYTDASPQKSDTNVYWKKETEVIASIRKHLYALK